MQHSVRIRFLPFIVLFLLFAPTVFAREGLEMHFRGTLNTKTVIYMRLVQTNDDSVHGDYMYLTSGKIIFLRGTVKNGKCNITQFSDAGQPSGTFIGGFKEIEFTGGIKEIKLSGMWLSRDSSTFFRFELTRSGPVIETVKTHKSILLPSDSSIVVEAFAPKIKDCDDDNTQKNNTYLDSAMCEYTYKDLTPNEHGKNKNEYDIHYITDNILSVSSWGRDDIRGVGIRRSTSATLNLKTGKPLRIKDAFKSAALKKVGELVRRAFLSCAGMTPDAVVRSCINIRPTSTNFTVDAYQITFDFVGWRQDGEKYSDEFLCEKFSIPLKDLVEYIDPKGPFKTFLVLW